jgi:hypothetical protein
MLKGPLLLVLLAIDRENGTQTRRREVFFFKASVAM